MSPGARARDTIAAIASPPGGARRGVLRLSGPDALAIARRCVRLEGRAVGGRGLYRGRLEDGRGQQPVTLWWMPGPSSYTREDVVELHLPGARPLLERALARVLEMGARAAEGGEFTRRAFENGRLDLTQAEGVLELVAARGDDERRAGLQLLTGGLRRRTDALRAELADLAALGEASLDFDEADTGHVPEEELLARARSARAALDDALAWETRREPPAGRPRVVLVGAPNAGKSALFNALVGERALVSDEPGTTRDPLVARWSLGPLDCDLVDLPGPQAGSSEADRRAQALAAEEREAADLWIEVVAAHAPAPACAAQGPGRVLAWSQVDRAGAASKPPAERASPGSWAATSARTGAGLERLARLVAAELLGRQGGAGAREVSARHRAALSAARGALDQALGDLAAGAPLDLVAAGWRSALAELDAIAGRTTPEDLLDRIFARFCLGK